MVAGDYFFATSMLLRNRKATDRASATEMLAVSEICKSTQVFSWSNSARRCVLTLPFFPGMVTSYAAAIQSPALTKEGADVGVIPACFIATNSPAQNLS